MANLAPLLGVQYFESLVYPNGQLPFWGSGTGVSMGAAVTEAAARRANSTMIDRIFLPVRRYQNSAHILPKISLLFLSVRPR